MLYKLLVWDLQIPGWIDPSEVTLSATERQQIMEDHIDAVISRYCNPNVYPGVLTSIDVVNEAFNNTGQLKTTGPWAPINNYIDLAFQKADEVRIDCGRQDIRLFYNDFGYEYGYTSQYEDQLAKTNGIYNYLDQLIDTGTPIDGVGFQTHLTIDPNFPNFHSIHDLGHLVSNMLRFIQLGIDVEITELDVQIWDYSTDTAFNDPTIYYEDQALVFSEIAYACILAQRLSGQQNLPNGCTGIITWGTNDADSWRVGTHGNTDPLLFWNRTEKLWDTVLDDCIDLVNLGANENSVLMYCPKPAYYSVYDMFNLPAIWPESVFLPMLQNNSYPAPLSGKQ